MSAIPRAHPLHHEPQLQFSDRIMLALLLFVLIQDELKRLGLLSKYLALMPELLGVFMLGLLMLGAGRVGGLRLAPVYWIVFGAVSLHIVLGAVFNDANIGSVITSLRYYVRWVPVFLLPVFFGVSDHALRLQLKLVAIVALVQVPVAVIQRFVAGLDFASGDIVRGTLPNSASLSIFLACVISMWVAACTKGVQPVIRAAWVCLLLMVPMTLNESKGALILMPAGVMLVSISFGSFHERMRRTLWAFGIVAVFLAMYIPIYNSYMDNKDEGRGSIVTFILEGRITTYLAGREMGNENRFGRVDGLIAPVRNHIQEGPITLIFGLGSGAVSDSFLGGLFEGDHFDASGELVYASVSKLLWELGLFGVLGSFLILWLIYRDAKLLKNASGVDGALGLGWVAVVGVMVLSAFYSEVMSKEAIAYTFWYFSGVVAAKAHVMRVSRPVHGAGAASVGAKWN